MTSKRQIGLGQKLGLSAMQIYALETGRRNCTETIRILCNALHRLGELDKIPDFAKDDR